MNREQSAGAALLNNLFEFGRLLRNMGVDVHVGRLLDVAEALLYVDLSKRDDVYHTCRTLLVHRHEHLALFDQAFNSFWRRHRVRAERDDGDAGSDRPGSGAPGAVTLASEHHVGAHDAADPAAQPDSAEPTADVRTWSDVEALSQKDFAEFTAEEIALARTAFDRLTWTPGERRTRRWVQGRGPRVDMRRALARSLRTGGTILTLPRRRRKRRPRSIVLICDISGSMERYSRVLLHFAYAILRRHRRVEAFVFSTELTRITLQLRIVASIRPSRPLRTPCPTGPEAPGSASPCSSSIGDGPAAHCTGARLCCSCRMAGIAANRCSSGDQVARLQRSAHRLIWLNPLIGTPDYAPLTRGLQAALPFVDDFLPARTLTNLADLAVHLNTLTGPHRA